MIAAEVADPSKRAISASACHSGAGRLHRWRLALKRFSHAEQDPIQPGHTLTVTAVVEFCGGLCLRYEVTPAPAALEGDARWHEGPAGAVVCDRGVVGRQCRSAYRRASDGSRVIGTLDVGRGVQRGDGLMRVVFPPLAHTAGVSQPLCEVDLEVGPERTELISIRWV